MMGARKQRKLLSKLVDLYYRGLKLQTGSLTFPLNNMDSE